MPFPVENIRKACARKGITIKKLEKELNIGNGVIARWKNAKGFPPYDRIVAIADFLNVPVSELTDSENEQKKEAPSLDGKELTDAEQTLLTLFRQIPAEKQEAILGLIESALRVQGLL